MITINIDKAKDITKSVDSCTTTDELKALSCEKSE